MRVLVCDGDQRAALAITRSLGSRGISVMVGEETPASLASSSRFCTEQVTYPSPYRDQAAFETFLLDLIDRRSIDALIPVTEVTTHLVAKHQRTIRVRTHVAVPDVEAFGFVSDKWRLLGHAAHLGVAIPRTVFVNDSSALESLLSQVEYPAVVKPFRSRIHAGDGWLSTSVQYANSASELVALYRDTPYLQRYPSMIQERVIGQGIGVSVLFDHGRLVSIFGHKRLREKPPSGGVSVLCESIPIEPLLRHHAVALLQPLGWHGVAMIEYKRQARGATPVLMEINGRFWGSVQLAIDAGVDFPYLALRLAREDPLWPSAQYRIGVRSRWLLGDLDQLLTRLRARDAAFQETARSRLRAARQFFRAGGPQERCDVFRVEDPRPMCHELREYITAMFHRSKTQEEGSCLHNAFNRAPVRPGGERPNSTSSRTGSARAMTSRQAHASASTGTNGEPTNFLGG